MRQWLRFIPVLKRYAPAPVPAPTCNPAHADVIRADPQGLAAWRTANPNTPLELAGLDFSSLPHGTADWTRIDLSGADLRGATFSRTSFRYANFQHAKLRGAKFEGTDLHEAWFHDAQLQEVNFRYATLTNAKFIGADITGADFRGATVTSAETEGLKGAGNAKNLHTVVGSQHPFETIDSWTLSWTDKKLSWEKLRTIGRLPLFGISYTTLIITPLFLGLLAWYNRNVDILVAWGQRVQAENATTGNEPVVVLAQVLASNLRHQPVPSQTLLLIISTVFLAIASTIYTLRGPSPIKEFSRDQWVFELRQPFLHYVGYLWRDRKLRLLCAVCYLVGGTGALWILVTKVIRATVFIWEHSSFTWW
jgi:hypothetical protein